MAARFIPPVWRHTVSPFCTSSAPFVCPQTPHSRWYAARRPRRLLVLAASQLEDSTELPKPNLSTPVPQGFGTRRKELHSLRITKGTLPLRLLLALSAAAALVFLRRKRINDRPGTMEVPRLSEVKRIDSHLHVWAPPEEAQRFPYAPGQIPCLPGSANDLLAAMAEAEVDGALIVQPINHKFDHSYVAHVLRLYPTKFVGCCLANPTQGKAGVQELQRLVEEEGFKAVRFNPYLWPEGQKMTNAVGKALFARAGELGIPVGFMCFKGLLLHIDEIEDLCKQFPTTSVLIDHLGFCKPPADSAEEESWKRLLSLARFPQVYVKTSAFFRVSREEFPYKDIWPLLRQLVDTFGAQRLMWGTDFPYVQEKCGYVEAWSIASADDDLFTKEEQLWIFGGTIQTLFGLEWGGLPVVPFGGKWAEKLVAPY